MQVFPAEVRPLCTPEEEASLPFPNDDDDVDENSSAEQTGKRLEGEGEERERKSAAEVARLCYEDPCRGMLEVKCLYCFLHVVSVPRQRQEKVISSRIWGGGIKWVLCGVLPFLPCSCEGSFCRVSVFFGRGGKGGVVIYFGFPLFSCFVLSLRPSISLKVLPYCRL